MTGLFVDIGCFIDQSLHKDGLELLTGSEVQLELFVKVLDLCCRVLHGGLDLPDEVLVSHVFIQKFHCSLELVHEDLIGHFQAGEQHDDLPVQVRHTISGTADYTEVIFSTFKLSHRWSHLHLTLNSILFKH